MKDELTEGQRLASLNLYDLTVEVKNAASLVNQEAKKTYETAEDSVKSLAMFLYIHVNTGYGKLQRRLYSIRDALDRQKKLEITSHLYYCARGILGPSEWQAKVEIIFDYAEEIDKILARAKDD